MSKTADFTQLITDNEGTLFKITSVYTNDRDSQKDLYQEIVLQLWKSYEGFAGKAMRSTWLYRVALNTAISYLRKHKKQKHMISIDQVIPDLSDTHDKLLEDRLNTLHDRIRQLDSLDKGLILLYLEDRSHDEMAAITGLSVSNVGTRISRIKAKLKKQMRKEA